MQEYGITHTVAYVEDGAHRVSDLSDIHFFLHTPKCGGNTFSFFMTRHFPAHRVFDARKSAKVHAGYVKEVVAWRSKTKKPYDGDRLQELYAIAGSKFGVFAENHFGFDVVTYLRKAGKNPLVYAVFRNPRDRICSNYLHFKRANLDEYRTQYKTASVKHIELAKKYAFADYVKVMQEPKNWRFLGSYYNLQTKYLIDVENAVLEGHGSVDEFDVSASAIDSLSARAFSNLETIDYVGTTEEMDSFCNSVAILRGWEPTPRMPKLNSGNTSDSIRRIRDYVPDSWVHLDEQIYERASTRAKELKEKALEFAAKRLFQISIALQQADKHEYSMDTAISGNNWYEPEGNAPLTYRWSGPLKTPSLLFRLKLNIKWRISLFIVSILDTTKFHDIVYFVDQHKVQPNFRSVDGYTVIDLDVDPNSRRSQMLELSIQIPGTSSEKALGTGSENRLKGIALHKVVVSNLNV